MERQDVRPGVATLKQAATYLQISEPNAYLMVTDGRIPSVRIGNLIRVPWATLEKIAHEGVGLPK